MILVGDVGGTSTRLALAEASPQGWQLRQIKITPTQPDLPGLVRSYLRMTNASPLRAAAFCGAGPVNADGSLALTNNDCMLDPQALAQAASLERVVVLNDFEAVGHAIAVLPAATMTAVGGGLGIQGAPRVVLGPGTGLGLAALLRADERWIVINGEGGHVSLAPVDETELMVWTGLRAEFGRVSAEHVLSGPGLERIDAVLRQRAKRSAPAISGAAEAGEPDAIRATEVFSRWLGRFAGGLALSLAADGGIYLAGGVVPALRTRFNTALFRQGFEDHTPHRARLRQIACHIVTHPEPGLLGLATLVSELQLRSKQ